MDTLNKLLDKSREMCGSDLATAKRLGVTRSAVSKWRHGGKIEPAHLANLIALTQQDPALSVQVMAEQDATPEERRMWATVWDRLSPVTSTVAGALLAVGLAVADFATLHLMSVAAVVAAIVGTELVRPWRPFFGADHAEGSNARRRRRPSAVLA